MAKNNPNKSKIAPVIPVLPRYYPGIFPAILGILGHPGISKLATGHPAFAAWARPLAAMVRSPAALLSPPSRRRPGDVNPDAQVAAARREEEERRCHATPCCYNASFP